MSQSSSSLSQRRAVSSMGRGSSPPASAPRSTSSPARRMAAASRARSSASLSRAATGLFTNISVASSPPSVADVTYMEPQRLKKRLAAWYISCSAGRGDHSSCDSTSCRSRYARAAGTNTRVTNCIQRSRGTHRMADPSRPSRSASTMPTSASVMAAGSSSLAMRTARAAAMTATSSATMSRSLWFSCSPRRNSVRDMNWYTCHSWPSRYREVPTMSSSSDGTPLARIMAASCAGVAEPPAAMASVPLSVLLPPLRSACACSNRTYRRSSTAGSSYACCAS
mmetsp:Transcript_29481/g.96259  ORF Transcript_29481/g.96259 Transcript_29481/m.96259 type:complete len:281 (-) Transcript_29481:398-1240(-)